MTEQQLRSYAGTYGAVLYRGLGSKYDNYDYEFKNLVWAEDGQSHAPLSVAKALATVKKHLSSAFDKLSRSSEYRQHKASLIDWKKVVDQAGSSDEIILVLKQADKQLFPAPTNDPLYDAFGDD